MRVMGVDTSTKTGYVILDDKGDVASVGVMAAFKRSWDKVLND